MTKIRLRVLDTKIREIDHSEVINFNSIEDIVDEIEKMYQFEDDKTEMNEMIRQYKERDEKKNNP